MCLYALDGRWRVKHLPHVLERFVRAAVDLDVLS